jgi:hypothetical protein
VLRGRSRALGRIAAFAAAYALVLNALIAGFLLAAIPASAYASDYEICHAATADGGGLASDSHAGTKRAAAHCKLCVSPSGAAAPPPEQPQLTSRVALDAPRQAAFTRRLLEFARFTQTSPRGPPDQT